MKKCAVTIQKKINKKLSSIKRKNAVQKNHKFLLLQIFLRFFANTFCYSDKFFLHYFLSLYLIFFPLFFSHSSFDSFLLLPNSSNSSIFLMQLSKSQLAFVIC